MLLEVTDTVLTRSTPQNLTTLKLMKSQISELKTGSLLYRKEVSVNPVHEMAEQAVLIKRKILEQEKVLKDIQQQFQDIVLVDTPDVVTAKKVQPFILSLVNLECLFYLPIYSFRANDRITCKKGQLLRQHCNIANMKSYTLQPPLSIMVPCGIERINHCFCFSFLDFQTTG